MTRQYQPHLNAEERDDAGGENRIDRRLALSSAVRFALLSAVLVANPLRFAWALSPAALADLSQKDAGSGVKAALERGAQIAVELLGKENGFWGNERVRIPLPDWIQKAERAIKLIGRGKDVDDLKLGVNRKWAGPKSPRSSPATRCTARTNTWPRSRSRPWTAC